MAGKTPSWLVNRAAGEISAFAADVQKGNAPAQWGENARNLAMRCLWISIANLFVAFAVWSIWSVLVVKLPRLGFDYSLSQLFLLVALPALSAVLSRLFYGYGLSALGGRCWTALSTGVLLIPCLGLAYVLRDSQTPYWLMAFLALLCGLGGGSFSSSMLHLADFFPPSQRSWALSLNAGLGNLGIAALQLLTPLALSAGCCWFVFGQPHWWLDESGWSRPLWLQNAPLIWLPFIILAVLLAWFGLQDRNPNNAVFNLKRRGLYNAHVVYLGCLYMGTFGSILGLSFALPLVLSTLFPAYDPLRFVFICPLAAALARPLGAVLADRLGAGPITLWGFVMMSLSALAIFFALPWTQDPAHLMECMTLFVLLFAAAGLGNGALFRMVSTVFVTVRCHELQASDINKVQACAEQEAIQAQILMGAMAAFAGFLLPLLLALMMLMTSSLNSAFLLLSLFYLSCMALTWYRYCRAESPVAC
ncbi:MFS transporter [Aliiglaciecola sp. CAU 1673]|uniref:MFS transporter n=1 Tax=Aliiglaciecola sp. CAU 1673 TaxID=3032595 RepID=UPI0023DAFCF1|nr:MFS transporter [Aliiglaciecola sp. CAU 1673]MDF2177421.1 MFS transporter [Aliiglaciecola sp. CAU 1673]